MEKLDKNYIIGFILLFLMYGTYVYFYEPAPEKPKETPKTTQQAPSTIVNSAIPGIQSDSLSKVPEKVVSLENKDIKVYFSTLGAGIEKVELKNYKSYNSFINNKKVPLVLFDGKKSDINFLIPINTGNVNTNSINFSTSDVSGSATGKETKKITFVSNINGNNITKTYEISGSGYEIKQSLGGTTTSNQPVQMVWNHQFELTENDLAENRKSAQINYFDKEQNFDDLGFASTGNDEETVELPLKWFSFKQKYFTSGVISEKGFFENAKLDIKTPETDTSIVKTAKAISNFPVSDFTQNKISLKYFFGPNELSDLKSAGNDFQKNLYLGYDIVKPVNLYVFVPLFKWVESFVNNYGLLIILVVLIIKIVLTPLIYKSYVSSAKMRVLAPEINAIKEKVGDDAMKVQQETMKLYQQVGVSPLSGCIPLLLQMPILMSVFFLFPNMTMFRQKSFLWANDLSTYDAPLRWGFDLPIIGNHISLFVVLMTLSSLAFTYYNNQVTPDQPGPVDMKKISYIFPLVFFFVLNSFPAALSFYYLVSNVVTIVQQLIVRKFVDEDKILAILERNRKNYQSKPQKKNKFGDFLQKQLQASEDMKKQAEQKKKSIKKK